MWKKYSYSLIDYLTSHIETITELIVMSIFWGVFVIIDNWWVWAVFEVIKQTGEQARVTPNRSGLYDPQFRDEKESCCGQKSLSRRPTALTSSGEHVIRDHINFWSGESKERPGM